MISTAVAMEIRLQKVYSHCRGGSVPGGQRDSKSEDENTWKKWGVGGMCAVSMVTGMQLEEALRAVRGGLWCSVWLTPHH